MDIYSEIFKVTLPDVGENNCLTNKGILRMLQEIACTHSATCGFGVNDTHSTGLGWIILNWKLKVFSRPVWNTKLKINTWSSSQSLLFFTRDFEVFDEADNLIAIATSKWVLFDFKKGSLAKISDDFKAMYKEVDKHVFDTSTIGKLKEPENSQMVCEYTVQKRDIDTNHHVNNLIYLDLAYEVLPNDIFFNTDFKNVEIMYKHEAKLGDTLHLFYAENKDLTFITIKNISNDKLHCIIKLY